MKKENKPLVSVIMNCHNGQKFLSDAIQSVINQSFKNWELIFWDNSSSDNSRNILKSFSEDSFKYKDYLLGTGREKFYPVNNISAIVT